MAFLSAFGYFKKNAIVWFQKYDIGGFVNGEWKLLPGWYPLHSFVELIWEIERLLGEKLVFQIGRKIVSHAIFPENITDIYSAIEVLDNAYHLNHSLDGVNPMFNPQTGLKQNGIGNYIYEVIPEENSILCICENPFPTAFDEGILDALIQKYQPMAILELLEDKGTRRQGKTRDYFKIMIPTSRFYKAIE